ncbi:hypothetical protein T484DRAFT_3274897 [Baffinella frigidus]|nr:hypothetical protein T484DRAFT_3274897 [Cryptophyta sp. CCMP2293]
MKKGADYGGAQQDDYMMSRPADLGFSADMLAFLRGVFALLSLGMAVTIFATCYTDGSPFRTELLVPWMVATLIDFYTNQLVIYMWDPTLNPKP